MRYGSLRSELIMISCKTTLYDHFSSRSWSHRGPMKTGLDQVSHALCPRFVLYEKACAQRYGTSILYSVCEVLRVEQSEDPDL